MEKKEARVFKQFCHCFINSSMCAWSRGSICKRNCKRNISLSSLKRYGSHGLEICNRMRWICRKCRWSNQSRNIDQESGTSARVSQGCQGDALQHHSHVPSVNTCNQCVDRSDQKHLLIIKNYLKSIYIHLFSVALILHRVAGSVEFIPRDSWDPRRRGTITFTNCRQVRDANKSLDWGRKRENLEEILKQ